MTEARGAAAHIPLSVQMVHAARCVQAVAAGRSLADALPRVPAAHRPGVQALVSHTLRQLGLARALLGRLTTHPPAAPVAALLHVGLALLAARQSPAAPQYEPFTVVDQAVQAAHVLSPRSAALVNASLRRLGREQHALVSAVQSDWEARYNHPAWWVKRLRRDHPQHWQAVLAASQQPASLVLRVNRLRIHRDAYLAQLRQAGFEAQPLSLSWGPVAGAGTNADGHADGHAEAQANAQPAAQAPADAQANAHPAAQAPADADAIVLSRHTAVETLPGYAQGWFAVQDAAAQLAAPLLLEGLADSAVAGRPLRVLDACAAPGGKTAHLLALAQAQGLALRVLALDVDAQRLERVHDNLARLGCMALPHPPEVRTADATQPAIWWDGEPFDAILLDAPCTASGIVRRHPDVRWLRRDSDVAALAQTQQTLLDALWPLLRPGGRLVYATCSVFKAEGAHQAAAFQQRHAQAIARPAPGHLLPTPAAAAGEMADNPACEHDGFFYARWDKALA